VKALIKTKRHTNTIQKRREAMLSGKVLFGPKFSNSFFQTAVPKGSSSNL
jgi:hypothetical protein